MNSGHVALVVSIVALLIARRSAKLADDYLQDGEELLGFVRTKQEIDRL